MSRSLLFALVSLLFVVLATEAPILLYEDGFGSEDYLLPEAFVVEERLAREAAFGQHVTSFADCPDDSDIPLVTHVGRRVEGALTRPDALQAAYFYAYSPCDALFRYQPGRIVVLEHGNVVEIIDEDFAYGHSEAIDLNGDGLDELVRESVYIQMGEYGSSLVIVSLEGGRVRTLARLAGFHDSCGTLSEFSEVMTVRVMYLPVQGSWPHFVVQRETRPCDASDYGSVEFESRDDQLHFEQAQELFKSEPEEGTLELLGLARDGFTEAQLVVGLLYARGDTLPRDHELAEMWLRRAAEGGNLEAERQLALLR